ncbi:MAG: ribonuclease PH, partial [Firmicutes bacterium]|nr:ribonuclease PH [Bacillota bacterium]
MERTDGRKYDELRPITLDMGINAWAEGSCKICCGQTIVHVTATVEEKVPPFIRGTGSGWINAEYSMLPRATKDRT